MRILQKVHLKPLNWLIYQIRLVKVGVERGNPLFVGIGSTKLFLASVFFLALLPQRYEGEWSWRIWSFLISPPNEIGDTLAGIAGALAFLWIIVTVMLQSRELSDQRQVLIEQRDEFEKQNANLKEQIFDNTFFQMLASLGEIVAAIDLSDGKGSKTTGRDCFRVFYTRLRGKKRSNDDPKNGKPKTFEDLNTKFFEEFGHEFGHYFRFLYNFFRFIDGSKQTKEHHKKVLRSFLSDYELALMFYNCKTKDGEKFRKYIEKYQLFDNLPIRVLLDDEHLGFYEANAYGQNHEYFSRMGAA